MQIYMALAGDDLQSLINNVQDHNDEAGLRFVLSKIEEGYTIFDSFTLENGGQVYPADEDGRLYVIDASSANQLRKLSSRFEDTVGRPVSIGLGISAEEARLAQSYAKQNGGGRVCPFDRDMRFNSNEPVAKAESEDLSIKEEEQAMEKAEPKTPAERRTLRERFDKLAATPRSQEQQGVEPSEQAGPELEEHYAKQNAAEPQSEKQDPKIKEQVVRALMAVKAHAPTIEAIKQQDPELYNVIADIIKSMLVMAKQATGQELDKSEQRYIEDFIKQSLGE